MPANSPARPLLAWRPARAGLVALLCGALALHALADTLHPRQLPPALQGVWTRTQPEMQASSRCAAAFDEREGERMTLRCSVHMRMAAEAERRALRYCEEDRARLGIRSPCRLVRE